MRALYTLKHHFVKYKRYIILGSIFIVLSNLANLALPLIVRRAVNGFVEFNTTNNLPSYTEQLPDVFKSIFGLGFLAFLLILGFKLIRSVCMFFMRMTLIIMSRHIEYDQKNEIFSHYQKLGQAFYGKNYTGDLMNRISDDVSKVRMFTGPAIMYTLNLSCMIIMVVGMMLYVNASITLYVLLPLPILTITIYYVSDKMNKKSDLIQKKLSKITSYVQETFAGIHVVKSYASEKNFSRDFDTLNKEYKLDNMALVKINGVFMPAVMGLIGLSILITVYVGGNAVVHGDFTLGNIVEYVIYVNMLTWPVASLGYVTSLVQRGAASQARINEFMNSMPEVEEGSRQIKDLNKSIEFKNVWFAYPDTENFVLKDVSFIIESNTKFGILGTTGSGKSTIAKLLMGVYRPSKGKILVDGINIEQYSKASLNNIFGYVSQDIFLFSESIKNNILFGVGVSGDTDNLNKAIESASLTREIDDFPEGLETILGERGITLSGGQKQRTAIARALIKNPKILLVDDGLSAVDTKTEVFIKNKLAAWNSKQTFINISHRISSVQDNKHIIFLDDGKIIEQGSHKYLIKKEGMYHVLFEKQMEIEQSI